MIRNPQRQKFPVVKVSRRNYGDRSWSPIWSESFYLRQKLYACTPKIHKLYFSYMFLNSDPKHFIHITDRVLNSHVLYSDPRTFTQIKEWVLKSLCFVLRSQNSSSNQKLSSQIKCFVLGSKNSYSNQRPSSQMTCFVLRCEILRYITDLISTNMHDLMLQLEVATD